MYFHRNVFIEVFCLLTNSRLEFSDKWNFTLPWGRKHYWNELYHLNFLPNAGGAWVKTNMAVVTSMYRKFLSF